MASFFLYPACGNGGMVMRVDCNNYRCAHNKHGICMATHIILHRERCLSFLYKRHAPDNRTALNHGPVRQGSRRRVFR